MKVNLARVESELFKQSFVRRPDLNSNVFAKFNNATGIYECLEIAAQGVRQEAIVALGTISVVQWTLIKGLAETKALVELAEEPERGWTIVETAEDARDWENKFVNLGPQIVAEYAQEVASQLLERTAVARQATERYVRAFEQGQYDHLLALDATEPMHMEATRLAKFPGVAWAPGQDDLYVRACRCIIENCEKIEAPPKQYFGANPLKDRDLTWRIQLLVDNVLTKRDRSASNPVPNGRKKGSERFN